MPNCVIRYDGVQNVYFPDVSAEIRRNSTNRKTIFGSHRCSCAFTRLRLASSDPGTWNFPLVPSDFLACATAGEGENAEPSPPSVNGQRWRRAKERRYETDYFATPGIITVVRTVAVPTLETSVFEYDNNHWKERRLESFPGIDLLALAPPPNRMVSTPPVRRANTVFTCTRKTAVALHCVCVWACDFSHTCYVILHVFT